MEKSKDLHNELKHLMDTTAVVGLEFFYSLLGYFKLAFCCSLIWKEVCIRVDHGIDGLIQHLVDYVSSMDILDYS